MNQLQAETNEYEIMILIILIHLLAGKPPSNNWFNIILSKLSLNRENRL